MTTALRTLTKTMPHQDEPARKFIRRSATSIDTFGPSGMHNLSPNSEGSKGRDDRLSREATARLRASVMAVVAIESRATVATVQAALLPGGVGPVAVFLTSKLPGTIQGQ